MRFPTVKIGDVVQLNPRLPASIKLAPPQTVTFLGMASVSEDGLINKVESRAFDEVKKGFTYFEEGDVLLAKITPCFENGKATLARNLPHRVGFGSTEFHVLRPSSKIDARYMFYLVWNKTFRETGRSHMAGAAGQKRLQTDYLANFEIPLPPLDEQRRIAAVLDKADALRRQRQESLQLTEKLLQSVFLDMFVQNPEAADWPTKTIEWMAKEGKGAIRTGPFGSQLLHSEFVDSGIAVLGIDNAVQNRFEWGRPRFITPEKYQKNLKRYKVFSGDLIITIMGTLGRCAIVPEDIPEAINTKHLCCITLDHKKCLPEFLHACLLRHPDVLRQLGVRTKGAVMPGLNMGIIKALEIQLPPLSLQEKFKKNVSAVKKTRIDSEESQQSLEDFFGSIQQRAFRGELDLSQLELTEETEQMEIPVEIISEGQYNRPGCFIAPPDIEAQLIAMENQLETGPGDSIPWSEDYFKYRILSQVLQPPFSFKEVMEAVYYDMEDASYEMVQTKVFKYLSEGILEQRFDGDRQEMLFYTRP